MYTDSCAYLMLQPVASDVHHMTIGFPSEFPTGMPGGIPRRRETKWALAGAASCRDRRPPAAAHCATPAGVPDLGGGSPAGGPAVGGGPGSRRCRGAGPGGG